MTAERDDVDAALDSLEAELLEDVPEDAGEPEEREAVGPPELPARRVASARRILFEDLFVVDSTPKSAVLGSPEEKVDYFRDKLRQAEAAIARVRDAWEVRDREMDSLEAALEEAQRRAEEAGQQRVALEQFFETKKHEFTEYIEGVTRAFNEKDEVEKSLRAQIGELREESKAHGEALRQSQDDLQDDLDEAAAALERSMTQADELRQELADTREALVHDIALRDEAIGKLKRMVEEQRTAMSERDATIEHQMDTAVEQERAAARLLAEKEKLERALRDRAVAAEGEQQWVEQMREDFERDLADRDAALERAHATVEEVRNTVRERDATIAELQDEIELLADQARQAEAERAASRERSRGDDERDASAAELRQRDATIARLRAAVEEHKRAVAERDLKMETLELQASEARRDALRATEQAMQQAAPAARGPDVKTVRLQKALHLADRLFFDLESGHPTLFNERDGTGEMLARLRKAVALARKAAEML